MPLSRIEIRRRATAFEKEWADTSDEDAEARSFWNGFFEVFGMPCKHVEYHFELYEKYTMGLLALEKPKRKKG